MARPTVAPTTHAWDQQPGESGPAFAAWVLYRDMGAERSSEAVSKKLAKSAHLIRRWSSRWHWVERAARWDGHQDAVHVAEMERAAGASAVNWANERESQRARELEFGLALIAKAKTMLEWPLAQREVTQNGQTTIIMPTKWRMADAAKYVETGSKLIRLAAEMETDRVTVQVEAARLAAELGIPVDEALAEVEAILAARSQVHV